jgi:hypothetical protein
MNAELADIAPVGVGTMRWFAGVPAGMPGRLAG